MTSNCPQLPVHIKAVFPWFPPPPIPLPPSTPINDLNANTSGMVLLSVLGYRRKWVTQTIRYCDLSPHWLLRAPGPPPRPRAAGIRAAAGAGRQQSHCSAQGSLPHPRCHRLTSDANTATAAAACAPSHRLPKDRGVMGFWKLSPFLAIGLLVMYQAGILQAAPFRSALENPLESATLTEDEICILLTAVVKDYVQMKARELQQEQETEGSSLTAQKSSCKDGPCVTNRLEGWLARAERMVKNTFMPTDVDPEAFGHQHKELAA
ncbi:calcitonin gene-related peptide 2 isoform X2 [Canis lupus dingo]|uniref:calcitonin gene-related peptide 2 isoform X2 n=1 Tax=Canis lupus dingo TaxID=286419 RepID=UPI000DC68186|nr:calcitonin gene-related peptide 2 isoform X2 [Canis lupus dingo]